MTIAHWCLPLGASLEALVEVTARVPAATATPTAVNFRNSRRLTFLLLMVFLTVVFDDAFVPALQPGSQHHAACQTDQASQAREAHWAYRLRLWRDGGLFHCDRLDRDRLHYTFGSFGIGRAVHLLGMTRVTGFQAGVEGMIGYRVCFSLSIFQVLDVTVHARDVFLGMRGVREVHAGLFMAGDAELRSIICLHAFTRCRNFLQRSAVRVVTGGAVHAALIVRADLPILPAKARIAVAAPAHVCGAVDRHGGLRVIGRGGSVAGFAGDTVIFVSGGGRVVACRMTDKTSTRLALLVPLVYKGRIAASLAMRAALPARLEFRVADNTIARRLGGWRYFALSAGNDQCNSRCQQSKHDSDQETFNSRDHNDILLGCND